MTIQKIKTPGGETLVVLPLAEYDRLREAAEDAADTKAANAALARIAGGEEEALTSEEVKAMLKQPTPLAFWRRKRGLTQAQLAGKLGISQPYLAALEAGKRKATPRSSSGSPRKLGLRMEDLVAD